MQGSPMECIAYLTYCDQDKRYEVKEAKRSRTLTQNKYYWAKLKELAVKLRMPNSEVHKQMLREWGSCELFVIKDNVPLDDYFEYYDVLRRVGDAYEVMVYKGSSHMDTEEFSRLIDGLLEECELQEIDVMPRDEVANLKFGIGKE